MVRKGNLWQIAKPPAHRHPRPSHPQGLHNVTGSRYVLFRSRQMTVNGYHFFIVALFVKVEALVETFQSPLTFARLFDFTKEHTRQLTRHVLTALNCLWQLSTRPEIKRSDESEVAEVSIRERRLLSPTGTFRFLTSRKEQFSSWDLD